MTIEGNEGSSMETTSAVESTSVESDSSQDSFPAQQTSPQMESKDATPAPIPESLRDKMEKKLAKARSQDEKAGVKASKMAETTEKPAENAVNTVIPAAKVEAEKPAYTPNFKFKFTDETEKQQEKELPQWAQAAIKDADSEKEVRAIFEKAHGLDFIKPRYQQARETIQQIQPKLQNFETNVERLKQNYAKGDLRSVFDQLGISEEKVMQFAIDRAKYYELPPEQQSMIQAQEAAEKNAMLAEQQASSIQEQYEEQARQIKQLELNTVLNRPEVQSAQKAFDERMGKEGAFFEQVRIVGETAWYRSGGKVDLTPEQAIGYVIQQYGLTGTPAQQPMSATPATQAPQAQAAPVAQAPAVKVIPNVGGRASSPASGKKGPRSIEDLRRISKEMQAG